MTEVTEVTELTEIGNAMSAGPAKDVLTGAAAKLAEVLRAEPMLEFAVVVGSRASGKAHEGSDWDIALQWAPGNDWTTILSRTETLRARLRHALGASGQDIDLIDLRRANLAMRAAVAEEGRPLVGDDTVAWARFLRRTWRELEDFYWDKAHAA